MTSTVVAKNEGNGLVGGVKVDYEAVLKTLNLDPRSPATQALVLTCERYELDPVLKHMVLIQGTPYVTHKGLWHIAHRSGELDGEDIVEQGDTDHEWFATVSIYRKGWTRPVTMTGRYPKSGTNKHYGPEMAVTRAECLVLRRLFDVGLPVQEERDWEQEGTPAPPHANPPRAAEADAATTPPADVDPDTGEVKSPPQTTRRPPPKGASTGAKPFQRVIATKAKSLGLDDAQLLAVVKQATSKVSLEELNAEDANKVLDALKAEAVSDGDPF